MKTMEICFTDLNSEAQAEYIETFGHDDNIESGDFPIAIVDREDDV